MAEPEHGSSPLAEALARVGDRWTLLVVEALLPGPRRFNDLLSQIPGIAANILSDRLKRLERDGLLVARAGCASGDAARWFGEPTTDRTQSGGSVFADARSGLPARSTEPYARHPNGFAVHVLSFRSAAGARSLGVHCTRTTHLQRLDLNLAA